MYRILRKLFFLLPAETAHYLAMNGLKEVCALPVFRRLLSRMYAPPSAKGVELFGLHFKNAVGLGAGFDKNARYLRELETLGFGFLEIGTVTPKPQEGNPKPRLFRLVKDKALINRMGFNNDGVDVIAKRLKEWRKKRLTDDSWQLTAQSNAPRQLSTINRQLLIGGNIGKNKATPNEEAWKDYEICFRALHPHVDFFVVNVSSPNTPGLRELQEKEALKKILTHLQGMNAGFTTQKPILLKIAPDLTWEQIDDVIALAQEIKLDGLVASNTTISRENLQMPAEELESIGAGGLSGKPVTQRSTDIVRYIQQQTGGAIPIIGSGGIFTGADAQDKITAGASLVEVWTGFIYEGPSIVRNICKYIEEAKQ